MVDFIRICSPNRICGLVTIQISRDFVKSGLVVKLVINAYASTVFLQITVFSSKYNKFTVFRLHFQLENRFSNNFQVFTSFNGGFYQGLQPRQNLWTRNHSTLKVFHQKRRSCSVLQKCIRKYGLLTNFSVLIRIQRICKIPTAYSVRASFFEQCSSIYNLNGGFYKDLQPKKNLQTRNHSTLKGFRQKRRSC